MGKEAKQGIPLRKKIFVILEGPDCGGKSTLADLLTTHYGIEVVDNFRDPDREGIVERFIKRLKWQSPARTNEGIILDRCQAISDIVYEEVHGRHKSPFIQAMPEVVEVMKEHRVLIIYVTASPVTIRKRYAVRGDEEVSEYQTLRAAMAYRNLFRRFRKLPYVTLDTSYKTPAAVLEGAIKLIEEFYEEDTDE